MFSLLSVQIQWSKVRAGTQKGKELWKFSSELIKTPGNTEVKTNTKNFYLQNVKMLCFSHLWYFLSLNKESSNTKYQ